MYNSMQNKREEIDIYCLRFFTAYVKWFKEKHRQKKVPLTERFSEWNISDRTEKEYKDRHRKGLLRQYKGGRKHVRYGPAQDLHTGRI